MTTIDIILKILKRLDKAMDEERPDLTDIKPESLNISEIKWVRILQMLQEKGLIDGVDFVWVCGQTYPGVKFMDVRITLAGIEYLADNTATAKIIQAAKLIKDIVPGL